MLKIQTTSLTYLLHLVQKHNTSSPESTTKYWSLWRWNRQPQDRVLHKSFETRWTVHSIYPMLHIVFRIELIERHMPLQHPKKDRNMLLKMADVFCKKLFWVIRVYNMYLWKNLQCKKLLAICWNLLAVRSMQFFWHPKYT